MRHDREIRGEEDVLRLVRELTDKADEHTILKLALRGSLPRLEYTVLGEAGEKLNEAYPLVRMDTEEVDQEISREDIREEFRENSFPFLLLSRLAEAEDSGALQAAYRLLKESAS